MGEQNVKLLSDEATSQEFMRSLLVEVHALEKMLEAGMIESGVRRIGAEQEMFLVDKAHKPALKALDILDVIDDERFTHELGLFNLEANLSPHRLGGSCLREMENELQEIYTKARTTAQQFDCDIALVGILPTLTKNNLGLDSMVPTPRYHALNDAICQMRGKDFEFTINGIDQLSMQARQRDAGSLQYQFPGPFPGQPGELRQELQHCPGPDRAPVGGGGQFARAAGQAAVA